MCIWQNIRYSNVTSEMARKLEEHPMIRYVKVSTLMEAWRLEMGPVANPSARNVEMLIRLRNLLDTMANV